jgi:mono/diheme cytochrome c family protein
MRTLLLLAGCGALLVAADDSATLYSTKVVPLLTAHCYECHGPKKAKHNLRLDTLEGILAGGKELGPAVIAGKPDESPLVKLCKLPAGEEQAMPPKGARLSTEDIAVLSSWIASGAKVPDAPTK